MCYVGLISLRKHINYSIYEAREALETAFILLTGEFLEIEAGGCPRYRWPRAIIYAPALIRPRVYCCINADCACSIGRGHDM